MCNAPPLLRIVIALTQDTLDVQDGLLEAVDMLNQLAASENRQGRVEIAAWWIEGEGSGFLRESPHVLIEEIRRAHNPDVIIGVFWRRFGTGSLASTLDIEQELERAAQRWTKSDHPSVMLYFCENNPPNLTEDEKREQRTYIIQFRGLFKPGTFWQSYNKSTGFHDPMHKDELRKALYDYLLKFIRKWKINDGGEDILIKSKPELNLRPEDWKYIDQLDLIELRGELEEGRKLKSEDAVSYFNGEEPKWKYTVSESIPARMVVRDIKDKISEAAYERRLRVTLLIGPGGEGKTTILQQVAVDLTCNYPGIHILWCQKPTAKLDKSLIQQLLDKQDSFVIICDNAALIAHDIFEWARELTDKQHVNIQFLLASLSIEWQLKKAPSDSMWSRMLGDRNFDKIAVKELKLKDAQRIVEKWEEAGPAGLGLLAEIPKDKRAQHLVDLAYEEEINNPNEGPLLGAMLLARKDDAVLRGYVENILARLENYKTLADRTLEDVFAYIAAIHADMATLRADIAEVQPNERRIFPKPVLLSEPILARALSCSVDQLEKDLLAPLIDEAVMSRSSYFVLVRHRRIAVVAKEILVKKLPSRFNVRNNQSVYHQLLRAARISYLNKEIDYEEIKPWNNLPRFYFEAGQLEWALALAKVLVDVEPYDPFPVVSWAHIYRDAKRKPEAVAIFRNHLDVLWEHLKRRNADPDKKAHSDNKSYLNKGYFSEWSVSEGQIGNHCFSTWLCGIALSDLFNERRAGDTPFMMLLSELTSSLKRLYEKAADSNNAAFHNASHAETFLRACAAAAWLGLDARALKIRKPNFNYGKAKRNLKSGQELGAKRVVSPIIEVIAALDILNKGIYLAWELREKDDGELPSVLPNVATLRFDRLSACFEVKGKVSKGSPTVVKKLTPRKY